MPGPLPNPNARRRNGPTIPTTTLPAGGFSGAVPAVPKWWTLGKQGTSWWRWAWRTPQAAGWGTAVGIEDTVARRASLVDDLAALEAIDNLDALDLLGAETARDFKFLIGRLAALATGRLAIIREMRELDAKLGLSPKALADLRWKITAETPAEQAPMGIAVSNIADRRTRLTSAS